MEQKLINQFKEALGDRVVIDEEDLCTTCLPFSIRFTIDNMKPIDAQIAINAKRVIATVNSVSVHYPARIAKITVVGNGIISKANFEVFVLFGDQSAPVKPTALCAAESLQRRAICMELIGLAADVLDGKTVAAACGSFDSEDALYLHACLATGILTRLAMTERVDLNLELVYRRKIDEFNALFDRKETQTTPTALFAGNAL